MIYYQLVDYQVGSRRHLYLCLHCYVYMYMCYVFVFNGQH